MYSKILLTFNALNISTSKLDYFNYILTPDVKVIDAIQASSNVPLLFPPYSINGSWYYDGGCINNCPTDIVDPLFTIAFNVCGSKYKNDSSNKILDFVNSIFIITNKYLRPNGSDNMYHILDSNVNDIFNFNLTKDDTFNMYMNGYINTKEILLKNYFSLPDII